MLAHILVCFLAYVLWKTLHQLAKAGGLGDEPRRIFEEIGKISLVDVVLPTRDGPEIRRRCVRQITKQSFWTVWPWSCRDKFNYESEL